MKTHSQFSLHTLLVALALTAPLTLMQLTGLTASLKDQAASDRAQWSQDRQDFSEAMRLCQDRQIPCPDINDKAAIQEILNGGTPELHGAATGVTLRMEDLATGDVSLLRRYQRLHTCPLELKDGKQPGFYELCLNAIKDTRLVRTVHNRTLSYKQIAARRSTRPRPTTVNERLDMLHGLKIRPDR